MITILVLYSNIAQGIDKRTNNQDTQGDNPATASQENSPDTSDRSYDITGSLDSREDDMPDNPGTYPAPNELSAIRLNDTSVVLRWEFPELAQEHLQSFRIQHRSTRKESRWRTVDVEIPPTTRAYQINGLRPGNLHFIVIALYDNDDNVSSTPPLKYRLRSRSKIKPEEMPEMKAPQIFWSEAKSDYFRFKWKYEPKEEDHESFGYLVYYRSAHVVSDFTIYNTMDSNVEIADVEPDTPYEAKVVAYNTVGVSEFSDTITIRTAAQSNTTIPSTTIPVTQSPSIAPQDTTLTPATATTRGTFTVLSTPVDIQLIYTTTQAPKPSIIIESPSNTTKSTATSIARDIYESITKAFNALLGDQSDAMLIIRYLLLVLLPLIFIVSVLICLIRGPSPSRKRNESPPSAATDDSMQFDLEINGYFKNSFPGVEKDYSSVSNHNDIHHGFVNNHPHLNDFA